MLTNLLNSRNLLIAILILALFFRVFRISYPNSYVFDEVYHAFTAKEFLLGHKEAWEYWTKPPPGVAYEWTHPPLAKEVMAISMGILRTTDAWAWRLPGALLGVVSVYLVYYLAQLLFKHRSISLLSAFIFSIDGLNFVQSRTGMNDVYFVTFTLASLCFLLNKRFFFSAVFLGLTLASKWTGLYLFGIIIFLLILTRNFKQIPLFVFLPAAIYLISYIPFFLLGHNITQFIELQRQMWWYHTQLKATHNYSSPWWSWPFSLYPIWYYVEYHKDSTLANIFASGNPVVFWMGVGAVIMTVWDTFKKRSLNLFIVLLGFFGFLLPWAISPRIMFLYHYSPSVPFLSIALGYQLHQIAGHRKDRMLLISVLAIMLIDTYLLPRLNG